MRGNKILVARLHVLNWNVELYKWKHRRTAESAKILHVVSFSASLTSHSETGQLNGYSGKRKRHAFVGWVKGVLEEKSIRESRENTVQSYISFPIFPELNLWQHILNWVIIEYKSSLVQWMPHDCIFALEPKDKFQKIWVGKKAKTLEAQVSVLHVLKCTWSYENLSTSIIMLFHEITKQILTMLWHRFSRFKR